VVGKKELVKRKLGKKEYREVGKIKLGKKRLEKKWLAYSMVGKKAFRIYHGWEIGGEQTGRWQNRSLLLFS
jgi:hypothetical protein